MRIMLRWNNLNFNFLPHIFTNLTIWLFLQKRIKIQLAKHKLPQFRIIVKNVTG